MVFIQMTVYVKIAITLTVTVSCLFVCSKHSETNSGQISMNFGNVIYRKHYWETIPITGDGLRSLSAVFERSLY